MYSLLLNLITANIAPIINHTIEIISKHPNRNGNAEAAVVSIKVKCSECLANVPAAISISSKISDTNK